MTERRARHRGGRAGEGEAHPLAGARDVPRRRDPLAHHRARRGPHRPARAGTHGGGRMKVADIASKAPSLKKVAGVAKNSGRRSTSSRGSRATATTRRARRASATGGACRSSSRSTSPSRSRRRGGSGTATRTTPSSCTASSRRRRSTPSTCSFTGKIWGVSRTWEAKITEKRTHEVDRVDERGRPRERRRRDVPQARAAADPHRAEPRHRAARPAREDRARDALHQARGARRPAPVQGLRRDERGARR